MPFLCLCQLLACHIQYSGKRFAVMTNTASVLGESVSSASHIWTVDHLYLPYLDSWSHLSTIFGQLVTSAYHVSCNWVVLACLLVVLHACR